LLKVVENQQHATTLKRSRNVFSSRAMFRIAKSERRGDRRQKLTSVSHLSNREIQRPFRELRSNGVVDRDGNPCFADSPRTRQRQQSDILAVKQVANSSDLFVTTDQGGQGCRRWARFRAQCIHGDPLRSLESPKF
jgi:hypothetical protein